MLGLLVMFQASILIKSILDCYQPDIRLIIVGYRFKKTINCLDGWTNRLMERIDKLMKNRRLHHTC